MHLYGLIGFPLGHSFSSGYFSDKFKRENIADSKYENFPLPDITGFPELVRSLPHLRGLNVTIPHKTAILPYLDALDDAAVEIGAVNCIRLEGGRLIGYNTDAIGFRHSLETLLQPHHRHALVLGTGGASKAVKYTLRQLGITYRLVSRHPQGPEDLAYGQIDQAMLEQYTLLINTTPLGMYPAVDTAPALPYKYLTARHFLYDLVYNPAKTLFLHQGEAQGAVIKNGYEMLVLQAEAAWTIWNKP
ncbi:shikimate dehydrogenase [Chitinophaga costaii]|uniref:Shikimate dehydrogenase n=1 Tax=Chitinophaga costaii TaxID=1335309 RepID=A0A1C3ZQG8_9BACT|nr:shikimate dehydrogenase [Chitinophaga costaii]PUZ30465.1 shikimate dehydrogenase [Chitinophaga costaii]SCB84649.1 shikimate dehydrogenase [Chitinophaga costaii]